MYNLLYSLINCPALASSIGSKLAIISFIGTLDQEFYELMMFTGLLIIFDIRNIIQWAYLPNSINKRILYNYYKDKLDTFSVCNTIDFNGLYLVDLCLFDVQLFYI